jgi:hypothetical protein
MPRTVAPLPARTPESDPGVIDVASPPFYYSFHLTPRGSTKLIIRIGKFSDGVASTDEKRVAATLLQMKQRWQRLNHIELYVGAVRLYNLGYRNEATYWLYSADYLADVYVRLADVRKMWGQPPDANPAMNMYMAPQDFGEFAEPKILGFAYCDEEKRLTILDRVKSDRAHVPDLQAIYPDIAFVSKTHWAKAAGEALAELGVHRPTLPNGDTNGYDPWGYTLDYSHLTSKRFPGGF